MASVRCRNDDFGCQFRTKTSSYYRHRQNTDKNGIESMSSRQIISDWWGSSRPHHRYTDSVRISSDSDVDCGLFALGENCLAQLLRHFYVDVDVYSCGKRVTTSLPWIRMVHASFYQSILSCRHSDLGRSSKFAFFEKAIEPDSFVCECGGTESDEIIS